MNAKSTEYSPPLGELIGTDSATHTVSYALGGRFHIVAKGVAVYPAAKAYIQGFCNVRSAPNVYFKPMAAFKQFYPFVNRKQK